MQEKSIDTSYNEMNKEYEQERIKKEREKQEQLMREREDKMVIEEVKMLETITFMIHKIFKKRLLKP